MKAKFSLYGDPPFALFFLKNKDWVAIDLCLIRPDISNFLEPDRIYDGFIEKNKIKIDKKNFLIMK